MEKLENNQLSIVNYQLKVADIEIDVIRKDIKNLHLAVYPPNGRVRIATPLKIDDAAVRLFAISKISWIKKHQKNFIQQERQTERKYISGESHYFQGNKYLLNVIYHNKPSQIKIRNQKYIDFYVKEDSTEEQRDKIFSLWYRNQLKAQLINLVEKWQILIGVKVDKWQIQKMKKRWGTCNQLKKKILFNLELAKKPEYMVEYIVVHELVHLLEHKHNDKFISLMDRYLPNWRKIKDELNKFIL